MKEQRGKNLMFGEDIDGDVLYLPNLQSEHFDHDYAVLLAKFLSERHMQKGKLMDAQIKRIKRKRIDRGTYCEKINFDLSQDENVEILTKAEQNAFESVRDEATALALSGCEKAISLYLQHTSPEKQNQVIRNLAEMIDKKEYKTAEEWAISASLHEFDKSEVGIFNQDYENITQLCNKIWTAWSFTFYDAREKKYERYDQDMNFYENLYSQLLKTSAYEPIQKAQLSFYGRNFLPQGISISSLDDLLFAYQETSYTFINKQKFCEVAKSLSSKSEELSKSGNFYFTPKELKEKLKNALDNGGITGIFESDKKKIQVKDVPTYFFKKIKEYISCDDEQIKERLAHARFSAFYQNDDNVSESGFWELETIASRAYKSEPMKQFNKVPRFLEDFQKLFETENPARGKEEIKL